MPASSMSDFNGCFHAKLWACVATALLSANALANTAGLSAEQKRYFDAKASAYAAEARIAYLSALGSLAATYTNQGSGVGDPAVRDAVRAQAQTLVQAVERHKQELRTQPLYASLASMERALTSGPASVLGVAGREVEAGRSQLLSWRQGIESSLDRSISQLLAAGVPLPTAQARPPLLVIYRPANRNGFAASLRVFINDSPALTLQNNHYAVLSVPPGKYTLRVQSFSTLPQNLEVNVGMGEVSYVETALAESTWSLRSKVQASNETAAKSTLTQMQGTMLPTWMPIRPSVGSGGT